MSHFHQVLSIRSAVESQQKSSRKSKSFSSYIVRLYYIRSQHKETSGVQRVDGFRNETCSNTKELGSFDKTFL
jgi:hypothetical protein